MPLLCAFTVVGDAVPQGSLRRGAHGQVRYSNRDSLMAWRSSIRTAIQLHVPELQNALVHGPVAVRVRFLTPKPPSVSKRRLFPTVAPDLDKLCRAVGDALESTVVQCDAQIVHWDAWKVYTAEGRAEARIELWQPDAVPLPVTEVNPFQQQGLF
jgi:Holliday junction resolvase RusA-like endonuclease